MSVGLRPMAAEAAAVGDLLAILLKRQLPPRLGRLLGWLGGSLRSFTDERIAWASSQSRSVAVRYFS
jgi:hypothetical protein